MGVDSYLFIDRETAFVYVRNTSSVYGGFSEEALLDEDPSYEGSNYKDAVRWASGYEPIEYGIYTGTLCPECQKEVEDGADNYPLCRWCYLFQETEKSIPEESRESFVLLKKEMRPYLP